MKKRGDRKRDINVSKRHARRIIANKTEIDITGSSVENNNYSISSVEDANTSVEKTDNSSLNKNIEKEIITYSVSDNDHFEYINDNIEEYDISTSENIEIINNKNNNSEKFRNAIAAWSVKYNIHHNACNALLKILQEHTSYNFCKDARTLLQTPRQTEVIQTCEGEYFYWGLSNMIKSMLLKCNNERIQLFLNIDGLPLAKSSNASLWPILLSHVTHKDVYLVGGYFGNKKPEDSNVFLQPLVNDLNILINKGYFYNNKVIKVSLFGLICDAPAKSFILRTKGHTGFHSCTKCIIKGEYINNRICFPSRKVHPLRTDELFAINAYKTFQIGYSILNNISGFLPITNTPLDYMHLVCLGVMKKIILLWIKGPLCVRLNRKALNKISHLLLSIKSSTPKEFVRKPRSISDIKHWKAVEFRSFLLYTGPIVLRHILRKDIYKHFLTLHAAMTILTCQNLCHGYFLNFAEALLQNFVMSFEILYGKEYISHNVHNLLHLCSDVRTFGPVDNFSAFRFENFMTSIKQQLRKSEKPLQQLIKRYKETEHVSSLLLNNNSDNQQLYICKNLHENGPTYTNNVKSQYLQISNDNFYINCKSFANNCCILRNDIYIYSGFKYN